MVEAAEEEGEVDRLGGDPLEEGQKRGGGISSSGGGAEETPRQGGQPSPVTCVRTSRPYGAFPRSPAAMAMPNTAAARVARAMPAGDRRRVAKTRGRSLLELLGRLIPPFIKLWIR